MRWHTFSQRERTAQLRAFVDVCRALSAAFEAHGEQGHAAFKNMAVEGERLLDIGFSQPALTAVARHFPADPDWLNPKALDAGLPFEPWQEAVTPTYQRARSLALDLRTLSRR